MIYEGGGMPEPARPIFSGSITAFHSKDETVYEKSVSSKVKRFPRWHAKAPASVSLDTSISDSAFRTYCVMALRTKGDRCSIGLRYLGRLLGISAATASRRVAKLIEAGHLEAIETGNGQRGCYRLTSPAHLRKCPSCKRMTNQIRPSGVCWICDEQRNIGVA
jgi:hypothetical protein